MFIVTHKLSKDYPDKSSAGKEFSRKFSDEKTATDYYKKLIKQSCQNPKPFCSVGIEATNNSILH
jgi:hypothetical protein